MTPEAEALAGTRAAPSVEARYGGIVRTTDAGQRMQRIGRRLCRGMDSIQAQYQYRLLNTDRINAFSLPGGRIYVTRGLYVRLVTDELLAAVLAHEMAHIVSKDHFKPRNSTAGEALDRELAADAKGVAYLRAAGISPEAMLGVIRIIQDEQPHGWSNIRIDSIARLVGGIDVLASSAEARP